MRNETSHCLFFRHFYVCVCVYVYTLTHTTTHMYVLPDTRIYSQVHCVSPIVFYHPTDGVKNPKYKVLHFLTTIILSKEKALVFNRDRCCHLVLCLRLILFHIYSTLPVILRSSVQIQPLGTMS
jgi:hypothetical protein